MLLRRGIGERSLDIEHSRFTCEAHQSLVRFRVAECGFEHVGTKLVEVPFIWRALRTDRGTGCDPDRDSESELGKPHLDLTSDGERRCGGEAAG